MISSTVLGLLRAVPDKQDNTAELKGKEARVGQNVFKFNKLECCGTLQKAKILQVPVSEESLLFRKDFQKFYIAYVEKCINKKCPGKIIKLGLTYDKELIEFKAKRKYLKLYKRIANEELDCIKINSLKNSFDSRFYLYYNEYGEIKRCYSNLSSLKLGMIPDDYYELLKFKKFKI